MSDPLISATAAAITKKALPGFLRFMANIGVIKVETPPNQTNRDPADAGTDLVALNAEGPWTVADEIKRQDDVAKTILPAGVAGTIAASVAAVAYEDKLGDNLWALLAGALRLLFAAFSCALALSLPAIARTQGDMGPRTAVDNKIS